MAGKPGRSGGHNRLSVEQHLLRGTFNPTRHAPKTQPRAGVPPWEPSESQLVVLGTDGRALVERYTSAFELTLVEGDVVIEAAVALDRLAELRRTRSDVADLKLRLQLHRIEQAWQRVYAMLLASLRVRP
jgi:hypothetical protein